jgi:hypothetical protein
MALLHRAGRRHQDPERRIDAGTAAMLINVSPILVAVLAGIALHEGVPRRLGAGIAVAMVGSAIVGLATADRGGDAGWRAVPGGSRRHAAPRHDAN